MWFELWLHFRNPSSLRKGDWRIRGANNSKKILVTFFKEILKIWKNLKNLIKNPKNLKKSLKNPKNLRKIMKKILKKSLKSLKNLKNHKYLQKNLTKFNFWSLFSSYFPLARILMKHDTWTQCVLTSFYCSILSTSSRTEYSVCSLSQCRLVDTLCALVFLLTGRTIEWLTLKVPPVTSAKNTQRPTLKQQAQMVIEN